VTNKTNKKTLLTALSPSKGRLTVLSIVEGLGKLTRRISNDSGGDTMNRRYEEFSLFKKANLFLLLLLISVLPLSYAETDGMLKPKQMKADFEFLCENLIDIHPNVYANFPQGEFEAEKRKLLQQFEAPMSIDDFYYHLAKFVARVRDDHTYLAATDRMKESFGYLPPVSQVVRG
jgi:hypothetical protein